MRDDDSRSASPRRSWLVVALAAALVATSCGEDAGRPARPNVVVIVIDTLRADRLPYYGHTADTAPFLAGLAERGLVFDDAWATSSWTAPATASIFTGLYPNQHGVRLGLRAGLDRAGRVESYSLNRIPDEVETLPTFMRSLGYRTYGASANPNIDARLGFERGFDRFLPFDNSLGKGAAALTQRVLALQQEILEGEGPFFLYLHFADPHGPYSRHHAWITSDAPRPANPLDDIVAYDSEIRFADEHIRQIFERLGIADESVVMMTSDHGQEFLDHGRRGHGWQLYSELTRVPLFLFYPPDRRLRGRSSVPVSGIDILPTLADLLDAPLEAPTPGRSALAAHDPREVDRPTFSMRTRFEGDRPAHLHSVVVGHYKLIVHPSDGRRELYDLDSDPGERLDIAGDHAALVTTMTALIDAQDEEATARGYRAAREFTPSPALVDQLEALGYAEDGANW